MVLPPSMPGSELVDVLKGLGFRVKARAGGLATMCRRAHAVVVPEAVTLGAGLVAAILRSAEVSPAELSGALDARAALHDAGARAVA